MPRTSQKSRKLSKRLQTILNLVSRKQHLWDICCDHGELGFAALKMELANNIHLLDRVPSIVRDINQKIEATDIPKGFALKSYCEDATKIPRKFSNSTIVIAGVGENTAIEILGQYEFDLDCEIILSIHSDNYLLREHLIKRGFGLISESILKDKGKYYEVLKVSPNMGKSISLTGEEMWSRNNPESIEYLRMKINYLEVRLSHQKDDITKRYLELLKDRLNKNT